MVGEREWSNDESARLPPMCSGFDSRTWRHMRVEFVVDSLLLVLRFSPLLIGRRENTLAATGTA